MIVSTGGEVLYRVNDRDEIVSVNDAWGIFATANGGARLAAGDVVGRSIWEFITDVTTRELYRDVLTRVRGGHSVRFGFRCDSPACRRLMEMEVARGAGGVTEFRARVLSEEERPWQPLLDAGQPRAEELVRVCGWCKKVDVGDRWVEVEEAVSRLGLFERPLLPQLTHGICPDCHAGMIETLRERRRTA